MIFTLNTLKKYLSLIVIIYLLKLLIHSNNIIGISLEDLTSRVDINSTGYMSLYWLWTNTYFLYALFVTAIFLVLSISFRSNNYTLMYLFIVTFLVLLSEIVYNFQLLYLVHPYSQNLLSYNLLLNNSINKIHPLFIYLCWIFTLSSVIISTHNTRTYALLIRSRTAMHIMLITLVLGSWWAYQEGSWGGWWNWDPSEMFGLLIWSLLLILYHNTANIKSSVTGFIFKFTLMLISYYAFLQLNFSLISHNFGIRQGDIVDFRLFYLFMFVLMLFIIRTIKSNANNLIYTYNGLITYYLLIIFSTSLILYSATSELWSSLLWRVFSIDIANYSVNIDILSITLVTVVLFQYLTKPTLSLTTIYLFCLPFNHTLLAIVFLLFRPIANSINLHLLLLYLILFTPIYSSFSVTSFTKLQVSDYFLCTINLPIIESQLSCNAIYSFIATCLHTNNIESKPFALLNSSYATRQTYSINIDDIFISTLVTDYYNVIVLYSLLIFYRLYYRYSRYDIIIRY